MAALRAASRAAGLLQVGLQVRMGIAPAHRVLPLAATCIPSRIGEECVARCAIPRSLRPCLEMVINCSCASACQALSLDADGFPFLGGRGVRSRDAVPIDRRCNCCSALELVLIFGRTVAGDQARLFATAKKVKVSNAVVDLDGDEMTR